MLIHEIFGGWHEDAVDMLRRLADIRGDRLDAESEDKSWWDKSFSSYHKTRISVASALRFGGEHPHHGPGGL